MGGASTQITFVPSTPAQKSVKLTLYGKEYAVYTHSFLCYGMKEAQRRFLAQLVKVKISVGSFSRALEVTFFTFVIQTSSTHTRLKTKLFPCVFKKGFCIHGSFMN